VGVGFEITKVLKGTMTKVELGVGPTVVEGVGVAVGLVRLARSMNPQTGVSVDVGVVVAVNNG
jgi:hypothetical protein